MPVHVVDYHGGGLYRHTLAGAAGRTVRTCTGVRVTTEGGLRLLAQADTIVIPGYEQVDRRPTDALPRALRALRDAAGTRGAAGVDLYRCVHAGLGGPAER